MKNLSQKQKIIFVLFLILFSTSLAVKIRNFNIAMKAEYNTVDAVKDKSNNNCVVNSNKNFQNKEEIRNRIVDLWNSLDEAIYYLKNNIYNKDRREEIKILIDDCMNALNSIENASIKIKYEEDAINSRKKIKKTKNEFKKLKKAFKKGDLHKCKEILVFYKI